MRILWEKHFNVFAMAEYKIVMIGVCVCVQKHMHVHVCVCVQKHVHVHVCVCVSGIAL